MYGISAYKSTYMYVRLNTYRNACNVYTFIYVYNYITYHYIHIVVYTYIYIYPIYPSLCTLCNQDGVVALVVLKHDEFPERLGGVQVRLRRRWNTR